MDVKSKASAAARWFSAAEACGDFMGIRYGEVGANGHVHWHFVSHVACDGIGGFARLLRTRGVALGDLPRTQYASRGALGALWRKRVAGAPPADCATRADWAPERLLGDSAPMNVAPQAVPTAVAFHLFDRMRTQAILSHCKAQDVRVNSFLLSLLDAAVRPDTARPEAPIPWMVPVNLRGAVTHACDTDNHVSCVESIVHATDSAKQVQGQIQARLLKGEHRANALLMSLGGYMSQKQMVNFLRKDRAKPQGNIGAFSNLGAWDMDGSLNTLASWLFCPPVASGQLLGAGCVTFQGCLGLCLQAHPLLNHRPELARRWMTRWRDGIETALIATE